MKCSIKWIDIGTGRDTPDDNEAYGYAIVIVDGVETGRYPCCYEHAERMPTPGRDWKDDNGQVHGWRWADLPSGTVCHIPRSWRSEKGQD
jgi:hypothetical protein